MFRSIFIFIISLLLFIAADAQKRDTSVYFIKNPERVVSTADSADYFLMILPPDTSVDKNLFVVKEYYKNGKLKMVGSSKNNKTLKFQGPRVFFFQNGHRSLMSTYEDGEPLGDELAYYPNGKLYYNTTYKADHKPLCYELRDSTGQVLTQGGNGKWIQYTDDFKSIKAEGPVVDGLRNGEWHVKVIGLDYVQVYQNGRFVSSEPARASSEPASTSVESAPEFPGGIEAFYRFLNKNTHYPLQAQKNGTQGKVIVQFVVERDGSLTDLKVVRGLGDGCDEEAIRVVKLSPLWKPGMQNGKPVRVQYNVPITFTL